MQTILIVDDTKSNIDIVINILPDKYDILVALNAQDALEILRNESIDLILLDIVMPKMDGYELCSKIKQHTQTKDIPIIFMTSSDDEKSIEKAYKVGGSDYITKPFKHKELIARVKNQLQLKQLQKNEQEFNKQKALNELIHNIAHQWRQPLSTISTLSSGITLQKKFGLISDEEVIKMCDEITKTTQFLSNTIDTFRSLTEKSDTLNQIHLQTFIQEHQDLLFGNTEQEELNLTLRIDEGIRLTTYSNQLLQVLISMVSNSKEAFEQQQIQNKTLILSIQNFQDGIKIELCDNAKGIDSSVMHNLFEPYTTTQHKSQNKGLGLYGVHNIVTQNLQGQISVENVTFNALDEPQTGAQFTIILPHLNF